MSTAEIQIQNRRGAAAAWTSANPVLASGEIGYETDTGLLKIGDGTTAWTSLAYWGTFDDVQINGTLTVGDQTETFPTIIIDSAAAGNPTLSFQQAGVEDAYLRYLNISSRLGVFANNNIGFYTGAGLTLAAIFDSTQNLQLNANLFATASVGTWDIRHLGTSALMRLRTANSGGAERTGIQIGGAVPEVILYHDAVERFKTTVDGLDFGSGSMLYTEATRTLTVGANDATGGIVSIRGSAAADLSLRFTQTGFAVVGTLGWIDSGSTLELNAASGNFIIKRAGVAKMTFTTTSVEVDEAVNINDELTVDTRVRVDASTPEYRLFSSTSTANNRAFEIQAANGEMTVEIRADDFSTGAVAMAFQRNANTPTSLRIGAQDDVDLFGGGGLYFQNRTDHFNTPAVDRGELWMRASDDALIWTGPSGTDVDLTASGGGGIGGSIANNQVAVGALTADEIEGTGNLEFDDSIAYFYVGSATGPSSPQVFVRGPANASPSLAFSESGAGTVFSLTHFGVTNQVEYNCQGDHVWRIGGTERMRLDTNDLILTANAKIGFDGVANDVFIQGNASNLDFYVNNANVMGMEGLTVGVASSVRLHFDGTTGVRDTYIVENTANQLDFVVGGDLDAFTLSTTAATFYGGVQMDTSGNILMTGYIDQYAGSGTASQGDILEWNSTNGRFEIVTPSGGGASEASGTWTVTLTPLGSGTITLLSTLNELSWYRVGDLVFVSGRIRVTSVSSPTGGLQIGGLPYFNQTGGTDASDETVFPVAVAAYTGTLDNVAEGAKTQSASAWFWGRVGAGSKLIQIRDGNDAGTSSSPAANMAANTELTFNFCYRTDDAI